MHSVYTLIVKRFSRRRLPMKLRKMKPFIHGDLGKISVLVISNILLSALDVIAIALVGLLTTLTVSGIQSNKPNARIEILLEKLQIAALDFRAQVAFIGATAAFLLLSRTLISIFVLRTVMRYLVNKTLELTKIMVRYLLKQDYLDIQQRSLQRNIFLISDSVRNVSLGIIGTSINLISDAILTLVILVGLLIVDPISTLVLLVLFLMVLFPIQRKMQKRASMLGNQFKILTLRLRSKIVEAITAYRELYVRDRRNFYVEEIISNQEKISKNAADAAFMPYVSKYTLDILVVLVAVTLAGYQFATNTAIQAITVLSIFLTASSRLTPALLRIQQALLILKLNLASSSETIEIISKLDFSNKSTPTKVKPSKTKSNFAASIDFSNVSYKYPGSNKLILNKVNFTIDARRIVGVTGSSGVGKTTLIDLMLGILEPESGKISISDMSPKLAIEKFAGKISYVPQQIVIFNGTLRENLTMGFSVESFSDQQIIEALRNASLIDFYESQPYGLDTILHDSGENISGGQRQRLGIARALLTKPELIVFDEATSALDVNTENDILVTIKKLSKEITIVMIAHRLSTLRICDKVIFLDEESFSFGELEEVRKKTHVFDQMLKSSGL